MSASNQDYQQKKSNQLDQGDEIFHNRFLALAQASADVFWLLTPASEMHEVSTSWQTFTGQSESEGLGRGWLASLYPADQPQMEKTLNQAARSGSAVELEGHIRRHDGAYCLIYMRVIPVRTTDGTVCEVVICGTDIARKELGEQISEMQVKVAVEASGVGIWDWDLLTQSLVWTAQCKALFGLPPNVSVNHERFLAAVHPDDRHRVDLITDYCLAKHAGFHTEYRTVWPDGSIHWLADRAQVLCDTQGEPVHMIGTIMDITDLKQAEEALSESEVRFRRLVDSNLIGIMIADLEGHIYEANEAFLSPIGYTQEDLAAGRVERKTLTPPEYRVRDVQALQQLREHGLAQPFEKEYIARDGTRVPVLIGLISIYRHNISSSRVIAFVVNLTERKENERQKDLLLSMTSHELKTPLAALKGTLQLVERRMKRLDATADTFLSESKSFIKELATHLTRSIRQVNVQTHLINDLLDVSRITTNNLELKLQEHNLVSIVREIVEDLGMTVPERSLLLEAPEQTLIPVRIDKDRISQVITNYVTNAFRYSDATQPVVLGISLQEGNIVRVWVRDKGPGLSPQAQQEIWQRFRQAKEVPVLSGSGKGLGLGLYISQMLILQHGGEVGVESTPGEGSTFWFTLSLVK